jgi:hypothetical protein
MPGEIIHFRPTSDDLQAAQRAAGMPSEESLLTLPDLLRECMGVDKFESMLAERHAKNTLGPEAYAKQQADARYMVRVNAIIASLDIGRSPFLTHVINARAFDSPTAAASAILALLPLCMADDHVPVGGGRWSVDRSSDVEAVRAIMHAYSAVGATRKRSYAYSSPTLAPVHHRLLVHMRAGGTLSAFAKMEGHKPAWASPLRTEATWGAIFGDVPLPPGILDTRRGIHEVDERISSDVCALVALVLKRVVALVDPLIAAVKASPS